MAEALFDEHPLEEYLRESGDRPETVPGGLNESAFDDENSCVDLEWVPSLPGNALEIIHAWLRSVGAAFPTPHSEFAERFKYDVISSALLSSSVCATPLHTMHARRRSDPCIPGEMSVIHPNGTADHAPEARDSTSLSVFLLLVGFVALWNESLLIATCAMVASPFCSSIRNSATKHNYVVETLESLEALKHVGSMWDSVVNEAITILENDERSIFYGPTTPSSPSSSLRVALHSSLLTTHHQCDNVRQLLAALTSPLELAQLSEMYAPASPMKPTFTYSNRDSMLPKPRDRTRSLLQDVPTLTPRMDKRSTWNGSYASLAGVDQSSMQQTLRRREKKRPDLSAMFEEPSPTRVSTTAPTTPSNIALADVREAEEAEVHLPASEEVEEYFGAAALTMRRKRRSNGAEAMRLIQRRSAPSMRASISSPSSRFTTLQTTRHPLSLSALHHALQGALASKRYACSHLLALRFNDEDDEGYWEDVRSVMALLTTTLEDASSRLADALDEAEKQRNAEQQRSPSMEASDDGFFRDGSISPLPQSPSARQSTILLSPVGTKRRTPLSPLLSTSFAPMPSDLARFAAHVDVISSALDDAREHLKQCVASLREGEPDAAESPASPSLVSRYASDDEPPAITAYERLRRELGLALRECERGRGALGDVFEARREQAVPEPAADEDEDGLPALGHDTGNGSSGESDDKHDMSPKTPYADSAMLPFPPMSAGTLFTPYPDSDLDDATSHLLLTATAHHLPPPGIEQVFESDSAGGTAFTRERSKMTREERIRLMKARRESGTGRGLGLSRLEESDELPSDVGRESRKGWGPGGEVVQELKDVIWKVSERRRKMRDSTPLSKSSSLQGLRVSFSPESQSSAELLDSIRDYDGSLSAT